LSASRRKRTLLKDACKEKISRSPIAFRIFGERRVQQLQIGHAARNWLVSSFSSFLPCRREARNVLDLVSFFKPRHRRARHSLELLPPDSTPDGTLMRSSNRSTPKAQSSVMDLERIKSAWELIRRSRVGRRSLGGATRQKAAMLTTEPPLLSLRRRETVALISHGKFPLVSTRRVSLAGCAAPRPESPSDPPNVPR
jgi:hypothetical protein